MNTPTQSAVNVAHIVYALHSFAIITGIVGSATVLGSFVGSVPSIVAVILNYLKRSEARDSWLDSHYRWQIRTFWFALLWIVIAVVLAFTIVGIPVAIAMAIAVTLWVVYRVVRGWLNLRGQQPMYT